MGFIIAETLGIKLDSGEENHSHPFPNPLPQREVGHRFPQKAGWRCTGKPVLPSLYARLKSPNARWRLFFFVHNYLTCLLSRVVFPLHLLLPLFLIATVIGISTLLFVSEYFKTG